MDQNEPTDLNKPPFFNHWRSFYWLVIGTLLFEIILFYGITKYFE